MSLQKLPIKVPKRAKATKPEEIFRALTLRGGVEDLWVPQGKALQEWDANRRSSDVVVDMTTGGGKTLVGLLIAQSLVNETNGKVVYLCPTVQLVEQTASVAKDCGIPVSVWAKGHWENADFYDSCTGCCITTYAAVFRGGSSFKDHNLRGIVFDDAHVAYNTLRGQFTIGIEHGNELFAEVANLFQNYFFRNGQTQQFSDILNGHQQEMLFVPMFEVYRQAEFLRKTLVDGNIEEPKATKYCWLHLKDKLSQCVVLLSGRRIEITPPILPLPILPYFSEETRRVYLTATLPSRVELVRTFGLEEPLTITPGGKSGEAQRQFLFVAGESDAKQRENTLALIEDRKACIISRSDAAAASWCPPGKQFPKNGGHKEILEFRKQKDASKLVLSARYDGIDFPGKSCRVLVLDGLPFGDTLLDRFLDQSLRIEQLRLSHIATRVIQAIGRIFRSNSDHGAVILSGQELQRWMKDPNNLRFMPKLLQRQIQLGIELSRMVSEGHTEFASLLEGVLSGTNDWDELYDNYVTQFETTDEMAGPDWFPKLVARERQTFLKLWNGKFAPAASEFSSLAQEAELKDQRLAAWFRHWEGLAYDLKRDHTAASRAYLEAANVRVELGRPAIKAGTITADTKTPSAQSIRLAETFSKAKGKMSHRLDETVSNIAYGDKTKPCEQGLMELGSFIGLVATRPDTGKTKGKGPDILWRCPEAKAGAGFDVKSDKKETGQYNKDDIGEVYQHTAWLEETYPGESFIRGIVGRKLKVSSPSSPPEELLVIGLDQFLNLAARLKNFVEFVESAAHESDLAVTIERGLCFFGLNWPRCVESMESSLASDLQQPEAVEPKLED